MPTKTTHYVLRVENQTPTIVHETTDRSEAVNMQLALDTQRRTQGRPLSELFFAVREADDAQGLVAQARAARTQAPQAPEAAPAEAAPAPKRRATRTIDGLRLTRQDDGDWVTDDGRYVVTYQDDFETECDEPHPVRISQAMRAAYLSKPAHDQERYAWEMQAAIAEGKKGYFCPGNKVHHYGLWVAGPANSSDVVAREDHFADAAGHLAHYLKTGESFS